jgi:fluoride exporter
MIVWVGVLLAGGAGAVLRFVVDGAVARLALSRHAALVADTAFVGSYTTFSTWMLETQRLGEERQVRGAAANLVVSIVLGIAAALLGQWIAGLL